MSKKSRALGVDNVHVMENMILFRESISSSHIIELSICIRQS